MATEEGSLKISLESLGLTLTNAMPTIVWNKPETSKTLQNCAPESLQKSYVYVSDFGDSDGGSIVVLGKSSLDDIQAQSLASYEQIHRKSIAMDCQSIISSLAPGDVEKKLTQLLQENLKLKETLEQNSQAMKQHLTALVTKQDELTKVHEAHKRKFTDTKNLVNQLRQENSELKEKMQQDATKTNAKESKDESSQTEKKEEIKEPEASIPISMPLDNEFAEEMLKLAEKSEDQAKEIARLQAAVESLNRQLEPVYKDLFTGMKLTDARSPIAGSEDSHRRRFLESFTHYNDKLQALGDCYAAQVSRYTSIQQCLQQCSEILSEKSNSASSTCEDSRESLESLKRKELQDHRSRLIGEELKIIVERQEMIRAQNEFQQIFTHYNSTLLELENLRQERERLASLQRGVSLHDERLDEATASLKETERILEMQTRGLEEDRAEVSRMKEALEKERFSLRQEEQRLVEANAALNDDLEGLRETNELLLQQCKIYEDDFAEERRLRENMSEEKSDLLSRIRRLEAGRRGFVDID